MKTNPALFSQKYLRALGNYLKLAPPLIPKSARQLGLQSLKIRLEILDLAKIHEEALIALVLPHHSTQTNYDMVRRAGTFFAEVITPIEDTHRGALEANVKLKTMLETLRVRTGELALVNKELKQEITQRKTVEHSLRTNEATASMLLVKSRQMQEELRLLSRRLLFAQEDERKRISRELHDVIAQNLTGINLRLAVLKAQSSTDTKVINKKIGDTQRLIEQSVEIVHRFARDLRPAVLDDLGLVPALRSCIKTFAKQTGIRVSFTTVNNAVELSSAGRTVLYRVAQESLANISRHAKATQVKMKILKLNDAVCMEVHDNGRGFQVKDNGSSPPNKRLGLLGMSERVEMVGGIFGVESVPSKGTTVRVEIPDEYSLQKQRPMKKATKTTLKRS